MNLAKLLETLRAFRAGAQLGDVAVLKLDRSPLRPAASPPGSNACAVMPPTRT